MSVQLESKLEVLGRATIISLDAFDSGSIKLTLSNGVWVSSSYWRLINTGSTDWKAFSSFDHDQKYGLPSPVDAVELLRGSVLGEAVDSITAVPESGDLEVVFANGKKLQIFNFSGYEVWEIHFPDGTGEYSNYFEV